MSENEDYIKKIIQKTGLSKKEIQSKMEEKKEDLKGLISDEGALFIVAKELGVDIQEMNATQNNKVEIKISDISINMQNITLAGRIKETYPTNSFTRKDGTTGFVGSFLLHDPTGDIRIVLWDDATKIIENDYFQKNELVKVINCYAKVGRDNNIEVHVGRNSKVILSPEDVDYKEYPKIKDEVIPINKINLNLRSISISGQIMQIYDSREFNRNNGEIGRVQSILMRDKTGSCRVTFWNQDVEKIEGYSETDYITITSLYPRQNKMDPQRIDLHFGNNSQIKKAKKIEQEMKELEKKVFKIKELQKHQGPANFLGEIIEMENLREVQLKSGEKVSILSIVVSDETEAIRVTFWRDNAEKYVELLNVGDSVSIKKALVKYNSFSSKNEATFLNSSQLETVDIEIKNIKSIDEFKSNQQKATTAFSGNYNKISDIKSAGIFEIKGKIVKEISDRNVTIYDACPSCSKKPANCQCEEKEDPIPKIILNLTIDDESGTIRVVFGGNKAEQLLGINTSDLKTLSETSQYENTIQKISENLNLKELVIKGRSRFSDFSEKFELSAIDFKSVDPQEEIEKILEEIGN